MQQLARVSVIWSRKGVAWCEGAADNDHGSGSRWHTSHVHKLKYGMRQTQCIIHLGRKQVWQLLNTPN